MSTQKICGEPEKLNTLPPFDCYGSIVCVTVGSGYTTRQFSVHEGLISSESTFFEAAFNGHFKEAKDRAVTLDEEDPAIFADFLAWLYTRRLPEVFSYDCAFKLYIFADARGVDKFKVAVINGIFSGIRTAGFINASMQEWIPWVYKNTPGGSGLRSLLVNGAICFHTINTMHPLAKACNEFVLDYAVALDKFKMKSKYPDIGWSKRDCCLYHEHKEDAVK